MIKSFRTLIGFAIHETDGHIGHIEDIYFDDRNEKVRFFVVDTGNWLIHHYVLLSPIAIQEINWDKKSIYIGISKDQLKESPDAETKPTVSQQYDILYRKQFDDPVYWGYDWSAALYSSSMWKSYSQVKQENIDEIEKNHLRSAKEILNYHAQLKDGDKGKVYDYEIDEDLWMISRFVIDCGSWLTNIFKEVEANKVEAFQWDDKHIVLDMTKKELEQAPSVSPEEYTYGVAY